MHKMTQLQNFSTINGLCWPRGRQIIENVKKTPGHFVFLIAICFILMVIRTRFFHLCFLMNYSILFSYNKLKPNLQISTQNSRKKDKCFYMWCWQDYWCQVQYTFACQHTCKKTLIFYVIYSFIFTCPTVTNYFYEGRFRWKSRFLPRW